MVKLSAGLLPFRYAPTGVEVFLVHPGGPFWAKKDDGVWSLPKGGYNEAEAPMDAARREFTEETGMPAPEGEYIDIGQVTYGNKTVAAWAVEADLDPAKMQSMLLTFDWPPKSGKTIQVPECDRAEWFDLTTAETKLVKGQVPFIQALAGKLGVHVDAIITQDNPDQLSLL